MGLQIVTMAGCCENLFLFPVYNSGYVHEELLSGLEIERETKKFESLQKLICCLACSSTDFGYFSKI